MLNETNYQLLSLDIFLKKRKNERGINKKLIGVENQWLQSNNNNKKQLFLQ